MHDDEVRGLLAQLHGDLLRARPGSEEEQEQTRLPAMSLD